MKGEDRKGTVTSFFTFWEGTPSLKWDVSNWNEIDGVELVPSAENGTLSTNIIYANEAMHAEQINRAVADPKDSWNTYEFQWTPDYISFLFNGVEVRKVEKSAKYPGIADMTRPQHIMMNFWVANFPPEINDFAEGFVEEDMPWYARYDWVEYWEYVPSTKSFEFSWRDEFDWFDTNRWEKKTDWTFKGNNTTFMDS